MSQLNEPWPDLLLLTQSGWQQLPTVWLVLAHIDSPYAHNKICKFHMHAYLYFIRKLSLSLILEWDQVNVRWRAQRFLSADRMPSHDRQLQQLEHQPGCVPGGASAERGAQNSNQPRCANTGRLWKQSRLHVEKRSPAEACSSTGVDVWRKSVSVCLDFIPWRMFWSIIAELLSVLAQPENNISKIPVCVGAKSQVWFSLTLSLSLSLSTVAMETIPTHQSLCWVS